eukprot:2135563-Prymnesium_polylepis.1
MPAMSIKDATSLRRWFDAACDRRRWSCPHPFAPRQPRFQQNAGWIRKPARRTHRLASAQTLSSAKASSAWMSPGLTCPVAFPGAAERASEERRSAPTSHVTSLT